MAFTPTAADLAAELAEADRISWHRQHLRLDAAACYRLLAVRLHGHALEFMAREHLIHGATRLFFMAHVPLTSAAVSNRPTAFPASR